MKLESMTWPEVTSLDRDRILVVVPIASCEQHGHHLPTLTDTILCGAVASSMEAALVGEVLLLPVQWLGASDHHLPFGATITASVDLHADIVEATVESVLMDGFCRVFVLNGHGGNTDTMRIALRRLQRKYPERLIAGASYWEIALDELARLAEGSRKLMGHACEFETSMMLHLRPDLVRLEKAADDGLEVSQVPNGLTLAQDFSQITVNGAIGFPTAATAEKGRAMLEVAVRRAVEVGTELLARPIRPGRQRRQTEP